MNLLQKRVTIASFAATVLANARHHPDVVAKEGTFSWEAFMNLTDNGTQGFDDIAQEINAKDEEIRRLKAKLSEVSPDGFVSLEGDSFFAKVYLPDSPYAEWEQDGYSSLEEAREGIQRAAREDRDIAASEGSTFEIIVQRDIRVSKGVIETTVRLNES